ncbi:hypothetical protein BDF19DRAFT_444161 [Syncephalis fuscata]|nr:hypothetical protein BDF19DRAFT_444161 [Syncephalis fuscata]
MPQPVETTRFIENSTTTCDYRALKACLERHQGDRAKCTAEWEAFQEACAIRRR